MPKTYFSRKDPPDSFSERMSVFDFALVSDSVVKVSVGSFLSRSIISRGGIFFCYELRVGITYPPANPHHK